MVVIEILLFLILLALLGFGPLIIQGSVWLFTGVIAIAGLCIIASTLPSLTNHPPSPLPLLYFVCLAIFLKYFIVYLQLGPRIGVRYFSILTAVVFVTLMIAATCFEIYIHPYLVKIVTWKNIGGALVIIATGIFFIRIYRPKTYTTIQR